MYLTGPRIGRVIIWDPGVECYSPPLVHVRRGARLDPRWVGCVNVKGKIVFTA